MTEELLVPSSWVADRLDDPTLKLVDVRDSWAYSEIGHLPGARQIPFEAYRDGGEATPGSLPTAPDFAQLLSDAGIEPSDTIVAYDDTHGVFAARFVVTALAYGHLDVRLLDGDFSLWQQAYQVTTEPPAIEPTNYHLSSLAAEAPLVERADVEAAIEGAATLIDTRNQEEYDERHLPGAIRLDWLELVAEESRGVKDADTIEALLADRGINTDREQPIILYCNTARRLSHTFVVLCSLGFTDVAIYEGSLTEWLAADGTIETTH